MVGGFWGHLTRFLLRYKHYVRCPRNSAETIEGRHPFLERTRKSYAFQQFASVVRPGWVRLDVREPADADGPLVSAFRSEDRRHVAVIAIHPGKAASTPLALQVSGAQNYRLKQATVTDRCHLCEAIEWSGPLTPESVTTLLYAAE